MMPGFTDPFDALFALQRALDSRLASDWMGATTTGRGTYPPINIFQQGDDFVAVVELPGVDRNDLQLEAKERNIRISGKKALSFDSSASVHRRGPGRPRRPGGAPARSPPASGWWGGAPRARWT